MHSGKGSDGWGGQTGTLGTMGCGGLLTLQTLVLQILPPFPKSQHDASAHQVDMREQEAEDPSGSRHG